VGQFKPSRWGQLKPSRWGQFGPSRAGRSRRCCALAEVARALENSENSYHRWRNQYGGMKADDAKRLKELERENARLKADCPRPGP
jgi:hypothetical protein